MSFEGRQLKSARGVDYTRLRDLLAARKWKKADQETAKVMLKAARREKEGWLDKDSIENFPHDDLRTIDQLWVEYSKGNFGFSVQKEILYRYDYYDSGKKDDVERATVLGKRVGWLGGKNAEFLYNGLTFNLQAPRGHLPAVGGGLMFAAEHLWLFNACIGGVIAGILGGSFCYLVYFVLLPIVCFQCGIEKFFKLLLWDFGKFIWLLCIPFWFWSSYQIEWVRCRVSFLQSRRDW
jgi:hypothetical protein